ncbi:MAG: hypothetical protein HQL95_13765, partial [Magnetococcales bacterium]|nr:hypothetical protein [Magnetococcales bacterium]
ICLLGEDIDKELAERFMNDPATRSVFPPEMEWQIGAKVRCGMGQACQCGPKLNIGPAVNPSADRVVLVGDAAISRLYKDGIGAAYITAKASVVTALFFGVSANDFKRRYLPVVEGIDKDNRIGGFIFGLTQFYQKYLFLRRGMVHMVRHEAGMSGERRDMSRVLWDTFTGSATYREILWRTLHPRFLVRLLLSTLMSFLSRLRSG